MKSRKSMGIVLGGALIVLAAGALRWALSRPETPVGAAAAIESETPEKLTPRRPGVRLHPSTRAASTRTQAQPSQLPSQRLLVEWKGTWYAAEILASSNGGHYIRYTG